MTDMRIDSRQSISLRAEIPPGKERRRALRQAELRIGLDDFTAEERDHYWRIRGTGRELPTQR